MYNNPPAANDQQQGPPPAPLDENNPLRVAIFGDTDQADAVEYAFGNPLIKILRVSEKTMITVDDAINFKPQVSFICTHTPTKIDKGVVDASRVEDPILKLMEHTDGLVILKSTVTPDIIMRIYNSFFGDDGPARFVYNPDFITGSGDTRQQFIDQPFHIFGGAPKAAEGAAAFYELFSLCKSTESIKMEAMEAVFVKYGVNSFLATKLTFFNEFAEIVRKFKCNYNTVARGIGMDPRIGHSHTNVPGFDGQSGFGGDFLPKDTKAFHTFSKFNPVGAGKDTEFELLGKVIEINDAYRNKEED